MTAGREGVDHFTRWLGMRWEAPSRIRLEIRPEHISPAGLLSGPIAYALIDYCMGSTLYAGLSDGERGVTTTIAINYVRSATEGELVCESRLDRRNDRVAVLSSEVRQEGGHLVATAIGSFSIVPRTRLPREDSYLPE